MATMRIQPSKQCIWGNNMSWSMYTLEKVNEPDCSKGKGAVLLAEGALATVCDVQETVLVFVLGVYVRHGNSCTTIVEWSGKVRRSGQKVNDWKNFLAAVNEAYMTEAERRSQTKRWPSLRRAKGERGR